MSQDGPLVHLPDAETASGCCEGSSPEKVAAGRGGGGLLSMTKQGELHLDPTAQKGWLLIVKGPVLLGTIFAFRSAHPLAERRIRVSRAGSEGRCDEVDRPS
jgi:hypothetical protein